MSPSSAGRSKSITVGLVSPPRTLRPGDAFDLVSAFAVAQIYETPFIPPSVDGPAVPSLFDGPLDRLDDLHLSGRLAAGSRFSDGTPLTAAMVASSLKSVAEVTERAAVSSSGDRVLFELAWPNSRFDLVLSQTHCGVSITHSGRQLGTGPYMLAPRAHIDDVTLVKNPHAKLAADIDEIRFVVYPPDRDGSPGALLRALAAGEVDFTTMLSRNDAASVKGMRKQFQAANSTAVLYLNTERPALADVRVRQALCHAIDRVEVASVSYSNALAFTATSLLPPSMGQSRDDIVFDRERAKSMLESASAGRLRLRMVVVWAPRPYLPNPQPVAALLKSQLAALGVDVDLHSPATYDQFLDLVDRGDYDLLLAGWIADTPDPADFFEVNLGSDRVRSGPPSSVSAVNRGRLRSRPMDEALAKFRAEPSETHRHAVVRLCAEQCPLLPLMHGPNIVVNAYRLQDLEVSTQGVPWFHTGRVVG